MMEHSQDQQPDLNNNTNTLIPLNTATSNSSGTKSHSSLQGNKMHPYLEEINRDMKNSYAAIQAQILRSRMRSSSQPSNNNNNCRASQPLVPELAILATSAAPFSAAEILARLADYHRTQAESFQQLAASLVNNIPSASPTTSAACSSILASKRTPPLSPTTRTDHFILDNSVLSRPRSLSLDTTEVTLPSSQLPANAPVVTSLPSSGMDAAHDNQTLSDPDTETAVSTSESTTIKDNPDSPFQQATLPVMDTVKVSTTQVPLDALTALPSTAPSRNSKATVTSSLDLTHTDKDVEPTFTHKDYLTTTINDASVPLPSTLTQSFAGNDNTKGAVLSSVATILLSIPKDNTSTPNNSTIITQEPASTAVTTISQVKHTSPPSSESSRSITSTPCTTATNATPANSSTALFTPASNDLPSSTEPLQPTAGHNASVSAVPTSTATSASTITLVTTRTSGSNSTTISDHSLVTKHTSTTTPASTDDPPSVSKLAPTTSTASTTKPASTTYTSTTTTALINKPTLKIIPIPPKPTLVTLKLPDKAPSQKRSRPSKNQAVSSLHSPKRARIEPAFLATSFNADYTLTLPDFLQQLNDVFDNYPDAFNTDADRIKYALQSMGEHPSRYFEPFLNKTVNDNYRYLKSYSQFIGIMEDKFGQSPSAASICEAIYQLSTLNQTGTMHSYITTFRDLTTVVRRDEYDLVRMFHMGLSKDVKDLITTPYLLSLSQIQVAANKAYSKARSSQKAKLKSTLYPQPLVDFKLREQQKQRLHQLQLQEAFDPLPPPIQQLQKEPPQIQQLYQDTFGVNAPFNSIPPTNPFVLPSDLIPDLSHQRLVHQAIHHRDYYPDDHVHTLNPTLAQNFPDAEKMFIVRGKLTPEEKMYRKQNGLCWYCGGEDHDTWTCALKIAKNEKKGFS
ncbi:hypothetical protein EC991_006707 [Linnemannia zychae]|nr:hypothetical protein EC991_006707 [Linnemannia zychae]